MEPVYIIGAGAIGKVLAVCLSNDGKEVVLQRRTI
jgi:ketopantoate reductase